jgi:hypothetical protein
MAGQHIVLLDRGIETEAKRCVPAHLTLSLPQPTDNPLTWRDVSDRVITIDSM